MENSMFFNSVGGDRKYKAEDFADYFASFIGNGVFPIPASGLMAVADGNMNITILQGRGWINGYFFRNTSEYIIPVNTADGVLNRIDRVVLQWNQMERNISIQLKQGTFAATPAPPAITRNADVYELALADIYIGRGVVGITQSVITDQRYNTNLCGIVTAVVQQLDPSIITAQFNAFQSEYMIKFADTYIQFMNDYEVKYDDFIVKYENRKNMLIEDHNEFMNESKETMNSFFDIYENSYSQFMIDYNERKQNLEDSNNAFMDNAENDFLYWFDRVKNMLQDDVATSLVGAMIRLEDDINEKIIELSQDDGLYYTIDKTFKIGFKVNSNNRLIIAYKEAD